MTSTGLFLFEYTLPLSRIKHSPSMTRNEFLIQNHPFFTPISIYKAAMTSDIIRQTIETGCHTTIWEENSHCESISERPRISLTTIRADSLKIQTIQSQEIGVIMEAAVSSIKGKRRGMTRKLDNVLTHDICWKCHKSNGNTPI